MTAQKRIIALVLLGVLCIALAGCNAMRPPKAKGVSQKDQTSQGAFASKLLVLKDPRDMRLAMVKLRRQGFEEKGLVEAARHLNFSDLEHLVKARSKANQFRSIGAMHFRYDLKDFILEDELLPACTLVLKVGLMDAGGEPLETLIVENIIVGGQDVMAYAGPKLYAALLAARVP
jgi:hypothetical protein